MTNAVSMRCIFRHFSTIMFLWLKICGYILLQVPYILTHSKPFLIVLSDIARFHRFQIPPCLVTGFSIAYERPMSSGLGTKYYCPVAISSNFQKLGILIFTLESTSSNIYMSISDKLRRTRTEAAPSKVVNLPRFYICFIGASV